MCVCVCVCVCVFHVLWEELQEEFAVGHTHRDHVKIGNTTVSWYPHFNNIASRLQCVSVIIFWDHHSESGCDLIPEWVVNTNLQLGRGQVQVRGVTAQHCDDLVQSLHILNGTRSGLIPGVCVCVCVCVCIPVRFHGIHTLDFPFSSRIKSLLSSVCLMYFFESVIHYKHEKCIWRDIKAQTWKISGGMFASYMIASFFCPCLGRSLYLHRSILWPIYEWDTATKWKWS